MNFKYTTNTQIIIDNQEHFVRMENGMTGIGSRKYWIDDKEQYRGVVTKRESRNIHYKMARYSLGQN